MFLFVEALDNTFLVDLIPRGDPFPCWDLMCWVIQIQIQILKVQLGLSEES